ncbi:MAG: DUF4442 domain-containing protein [Candidatus Marinimicrobia bacterium]|nr:DUF4442 domain-containing protein [Candidatus Neomarinimicrobiota bacterium]
MTISWKKTWAVWYFGFTKIPLILYVRPKVQILNSEQCIIHIPLKRRTRNHLNSLYFGSLAIGADLASGLLAMELIATSNRRISLVFKDLQADFLKRVDADACFTCQDGAKVSSLIQKVLETGERHHETLKVLVTAPEKYGAEVLAEFSLTLSLKVKEEPGLPA